MNRQLQKEFAECLYPDLKPRLLTGFWLWAVTSQYRIHLSASYVILAFWFAWRCFEINWLLFSFYLAKEVRFWRFRNCSGGKHTSFLNRLHLLGHRYTRYLHLPCSVSSVLLYRCCKLMLNVSVRSYCCRACCVRVQSGAIKSPVASGCFKYRPTCRVQGSNKYRNQGASVYPLHQR
jgi:hypothetical protein